MTTFSIKRLVEFRDTDAAGIVHFSVFFNFMEAAEHALLRSVGMSVFLKHEGADLSWPRVAVNCEYEAPVRFEDEVEIAVSISRLGGKSVSYDFVISVAGKRCAHGAITAVCCQLGADHAPIPIVIPDSIRDKLTQFVTAE